MKTETLIDSPLSPSRVRGFADSSPFLNVGTRTALYYKDWPARNHVQPATEKPVLFLHGWGLHSDMWQYQMIYLTKQGVRTVAYDRRGHGRSTDPGTGYDFDTLADDLAAVIDQLELRDVILVGHSMGCAEIVRYLSRYGGAKISRAAFVAPSLPFMLKTPDNPEGIDRDALLQVREALSTDFPKWLTDNAAPFFKPETSPRMVEWAIEMCLQGSLRALIDSNIADSETDFRSELPAIKTPIVVIHGDQDASAPLDWARKTSQLIPGSRLEVYAGGTHGLFITHMERLNRDLLAFIKG